MATLNDVVREVRCPECDEDIQVTIRLTAHLVVHAPYGATMQIDHDVVGSPVADHICERHPNLLD